MGLSSDRIGAELALLPNITQSSHPSKTEIRELAATPLLHLLLPSLLLQFAPIQPEESESLLLLSQQEGGPIWKRNAGSPGGRVVVRDYAMAGQQEQP